MKPAFFLVATSVLLVPVQAKPKIAILNVQKALIDTADAKAAASELHRKFDPDTARLGEQQSEIDKLRNQLRDGTARTDEEIAALKARMDTLVDSHRRGMEDTRQRFDAEQKRIYKELTDKLMVVVEKYAKQKHFEVVLDASDPKTPIFWRAEENDITDEVIKRYDQAAKKR